jgi:hypothetical protein
MAVLILKDFCQLRHRVIGVASFRKHALVKILYALLVAVAFLMFVTVHTIGIKVLTSPARSTLLRGDFGTERHRRSDLCLPV